jgi:hypothetical protein
MATYRNDAERQADLARQMAAQPAAPPEAPQPDPAAPPGAAPAPADPQPTNPGTVNGVPPMPQTGGPMTQTATDPSMPQTGGPITATPFTPSFDSSQLPSLSTGLDTSGYTPFDTDFAGAANDASDQAYAGLTQYMDEDFGRANNALESKLINQGLTPGTEAFNNEMSLQQRGQNDARMQAAVQAGNIGRSYSGDLAHPRPSDAPAPRR